MQSELQVMTKQSSAPESSRKKSVINKIQVKLMKKFRPFHSPVKKKYQERLFLLDAAISNLYNIDVETSRIYTI